VETVSALDFRGRRILLLLLIHFFVVLPVVARQSEFAFLFGVVKPDRRPV
jgi:hypothetical protein